MADADDLAARVQALEDVEAVKRCMYRYWRCLDHKLFDELPDVFAEDVRADYGMPGWGAEGRDQLVEFLHANESRDDYKVSHAGHNPEVDLTGPATAHGLFKLHDWVVLGGQTLMRGYGQYDVQFSKADGRWRIQTLLLHYAYREEHHVYIDNVPALLTPALLDDA
jgi:hypothetical protein